jgi:hypothetical protein
MVPGSLCVKKRDAADRSSTHSVILAFKALAVRSSHHSLRYTTRYQYVSTAWGKVLIGSAGAEYRARGFISAYDAQTGEMVCRFHTDLDNPRDGLENDAMARAAKNRADWIAVTTGHLLAWDPVAQNKHGGRNIPAHPTAVRCRPQVTLYSRERLAANFRPTINKPPRHQNQGNRC